MAKKRKIGSKFKIDRLPICVQQPRSPPRKRRTDFSLFFCSSDSCLKQVASLEFSSSKDDMSNVTVANLDDRKDMGHMVPKSFVLQRSESEGGGQGSFSNFSEASIIDIGSAAKDTHSGPSYERNHHEQKGDTAQTLEFTPVKSHRTDCNDVCTTPGSIVWAKTACEVWWPAEVMGGRSTLANSRRQGVDGHVLVQYYGNNRSSWVDPTADLSQFDECFEERSCNPMEDFQEALKQALHRKEQINSCRQLFGSPNGHNNSSQPDQSSADKWNSSSSSRTEECFIDKGRGKRKRMPKVRFDEVSFPSKSTRKVRRLRIMRYLGLAAPVGSPF